MARVPGVAPPPRAEPNARDASIASHWLCLQVLLWTTVSQRGANDQRNGPLPVPTHTGRCVWTGWGDHVLARRVFAQAGVPRSAADRCIIDLSRFACRRQARRYTNFDEGAKFSCNPDQISLRKCVSRQRRVPRRRTQRQWRGVSTVDWTSTGSHPASRIKARRHHSGLWSRPLTRQFPTTVVTSVRR